MTDHLTNLTKSATEVDDIEVAMAALPLTVQRLTTLDARVAFTSTSVGEIDIMAGEFGFPVATEGDVAGDSLVVALQFEEGAGSWNGEEFALDRAWLYRPGSEHFGVGRAGHIDRPPRFATITFPCTAEAPQPLAASAGAPLVHVVDDARVGMLRAAVTDVIDMSKSGELTADRAHLAQRDLTNIVTALGADHGEQASGRTSATWITRECIALADSVDPMPATADLATAIGVSDRWVRAAFRNVYGVSASIFFQSKAMDRARRQLRAGTPGSVTVTEVAMRCGFWHLGRFSATYRGYFGELPSDTLARIH